MFGKNLITIEDIISYKNVKYALNLQKAIDIVWNVLMMFL